MSYPTIEIYCDDESHPEQRWTWTFARMAPGDWMPLQQVTPGGDDLKRSKDTHARVDEATNAYLDHGFTPPITVRDRDKFQCDLCGHRSLDVPVRRERLNQILEVLHEHGVQNIRLGELADRLRRGKAR